jgi:glyoxylase-like metal-dependent hydrolase (beta-lactamase superfamily II)
MSTTASEAPEFSAQELADLIESDTPFQIMDVRAPQKVAQASIHLVPSERYHNIRGSELMNRTDPESTGLDPELPVAVICGRGKDSSVLAFHLNRLGFDARSLAGGIAAWMNVLVHRELDPPQSLDRLVQFDRLGKGSLGYLLVSRGEAIIIDPPLEARAYLDILEEEDAELVGVFDTHAHADYVSGGPELAREFAVPYYLHAADGLYPYDGRPAEIDFHALSDGDVIGFGDSAVTVVHTPGHTEGSVTYLVEDRVAFTGDFLFVESIGRPDLGGQESRWGRELWSSVQRAKEAWDPGVMIYPAHYTSESERRLGSAVGISLEDLLEENELLQIPSEEEFLEVILENKASFPDTYRKIKALNLGLLSFQETEVEELEAGRNECALGGVPS